MLDRGSWSRGLRVALTLFAAGAAPPSAASTSVPPLGSASDYRVIAWTTAHGLPQSTVSDIVAMAGGELWLATFGGLVRFDGASFRVIDLASDPRLPSNRFISLAAGREGELWFATQQGHVGRIDGEGRVAEIVPPASPLSQISSMLVAADGGVYALDVDGTVRRTVGGRTEVLLGPGPHAGLQGLAEATDGQVWAGRDREIVGFGRDGAAQIRLPLAQKCSALASDGEGGLWVGLQNGLARLHAGRVEPVRVEPLLSGWVRALQADGPSRLWISTPGGLERLDRRPDATWERHALPVALPVGLGIRKILLDRERNLWVGTNGQGLYRINLHLARRTSPESGLRTATALVSDGAGGAWVAGGCAGLFHLGASGDVQPFAISPGPGLPPVRHCEHSLASGVNGRLWVRVAQRLFLVEAGSSRTWPTATPIPPEGGPIVEAADGSLWVTSRGGRVQRFAPDGRLLVDHDLGSLLVSAVAGRGREIWVGGEGVFFRVQDDVVERFGAERGVPRGSVRDLLPGRDGEVWVATYGDGLARLVAGRFEHWTVEQGLPDNALSSLVADRQGRLWISTNRGLAVLDRAQLADVASGSRRSLDPVVFGAERGVAEANSGRPAGFADARGQVWFGTIEGVVRFDADSFPFRREPPTVRIDRVSADDRELPLARPVRVPAGTGRVRLDFGSVALTYPERIIYRFRFEGIDPDWVDVGSRRYASWTPAGPGRHRFLVEARNEDGIWSSSPAAVELEVLPSWWQTGLFRLAALAAALAALGGAFLLRLRAIEARHVEKLLALEERRQAEERVTELRGQLEHVARAALAGELATNLAHEVNQPLTAIVANAQAGRRFLAGGPAQVAEIDAIFGDIAAQGRRASEVIRGLRGFLRGGRTPSGRVDLSELTREMLPLVRRELEEHRVQLTLDLADDLPPVEGSAIHLGQILVNLVKNACDALADREAPRLLAIRTSSDAGRVELAVSDNGPGFRPEDAGRLFQPFFTTKPQGMGMGLAISRSIAEAHGGELAAANAPGGGALVVVSLPSVASQEERG